MVRTSIASHPYPQVAQQAPRNRSTFLSSQKPHAGHTPALRLPIPSSLLPPNSRFLPDSSRPKKSHAKKRSADHIPRPKNAFILFRCDFVNQGLIPISIEKDHRNISRFVGKVWNEISGAQKRPWEEMAMKEKAAHKELYPNYRYRSSNVKGDSDSPAEDGLSLSSVDQLLGQMQTTSNQLPHRRTSSCPPPNSVPTIFADGSTSTPVFTTMDDLSLRRPSYTIYHSTCAELQPSVFTGIPNVEGWHYPYSYHTLSTMLYEHPSGISSSVTSGEPGSAHLSPSPCISTPEPPAMQIGMEPMSDNDMCMPLFTNPFEAHSNSTFASDYTYLSDNQEINSILMSFDFDKFDREHNLGALDPVDSLTSMNDSMDLLMF